MFAESLVIIHLLKKLCQYKAYKDDKSQLFKSMLFAKFTHQAHAGFGRGICQAIFIRHIYTS